MPDWVVKLLEQWAVVAAASMPFIIAVFVAAVVIWFAIGWSYNAVLSSKNAQIELLDRKLGDYREKLQGATPAEAKAKLDELAEMSKYTVGDRWPPLSPTEMVNLTEQLAKLPKRLIQVMYSNYRGKDLAQQFADALKNAGWKDVHFSEGGGLGMGVSTGRGKGAAIAMKTLIESATTLKLSSFGPEEPEEHSALFIAVGINAK